MKICQIYIKGFQQFENTFLDFTHPETGEPVDKVCLIGKNGTGKTTILKIVNSFFGYWRNPKFTKAYNKKIIEIPFLVFKIKIDNGFYFLLKNSNQIRLYKDSEKSNKIWKELIELPKTDILNNNYLKNPVFLENEVTDNVKEKLFEKIRFQDNGNDLLIYSPSESTSNSYYNIKDVPETNVNDALRYFDKFPYYHEVSDAKVQDFWKMIVYNVKKRESEQQEFENRPENLHKTKQQLIEEFEKINPKFLNKLADLWNKILDKAGLEFDVENASNPIHLNDNLKAYIVLKGSKKRIQYSELSTGIRNYIFRVGHIYSLFFNRAIEKGFLLLDEPENSLFPDFLFELIETYAGLMVDKTGENHSQMFMATHNPIIAAQFEPYERIILEWEKDGTVTASKGKTPVGDDPNDILKNDFGLESLMGKKGILMWEKYLKLKKQLRKDMEKSEKMALVEEVSKIGSDYNFE